MGKVGSKCANYIIIKIMALITGMISDQICLKIIPVQFLCRKTICSHPKIDSKCYTKKVEIFITNISDSNYPMHIVIMLIKLTTV